MAPPTGFDPVSRRLGCVAVSTTEGMAPRVGLEPTVVGLEGRLPSFGRGVGWSRVWESNPAVTSLATRSHTM
jgi:hypothetical protein